jgi:hypothetical protein
MIPNYSVWSWLGLTNTQVPLWAHNLFGSAFYIFLLRQFFLGQRYYVGGSPPPAARADPRAAGGAGSAGRSTPRHPGRADGRQKVLGHTGPPHVFAGDQLATVDLPPTGSAGG